MLYVDCRGKNQYLCPKVMTFVLKKSSSFKCDKSVSGSKPCGFRTQVILVGFQMEQASGKHIRSCPQMCHGQKSRLLGMVIPPLIGILIILMGI